MSNVYEALQRARRQGGPKGPDKRVGEVPVVATPAPSQAGSFGHVSGAMSALFGAVRPLMESKGGIVLYVIAPTSGEGTSTVAREFALMAAGAGHRRTLLVDGDRRNPQTARRFDVPTGRGLIDCMWQQADYGDVVRRAPDGLLSVAALGGDKNSTNIDVESMRGLFVSLRSRFELTIVDCPPVGGGDYSDVIPEAADGIVLVVEAEKTRPAVVVHAKELLQQAGGNVIGAVLNKRKNYIPSFLYRAL